jgi:hypothetical protein
MKRVGFRRQSSRDAATPRRREMLDDTTKLESDSSQFRRNQTLSSFRRPATEQESERRQLHHLTSTRRKVGGAFLAVAGVIALLAIIVTQFVAEVGVTSSSTSISRSIDTARYEASINEYYGRHPIERVRLFLNQDGLYRYVSASHPEVGALSLSSVSDVIKAQFSLEFRKPIAGWQINAKQLFVDSQGVVYEENYYNAPSVQIVDDSGVTPEQGSAVASARLLSFVGRATHEAGERGYPITSVVLPAGATRLLELRSEGQGRPTRPVVRVTVDRGAREQVEDMSRVFAYLEKTNTQAEYVDVRLAGKAIYR